MSRSSPSDTSADASWSLGMALGAATLASACCTIPLALVSLGIGGAWVGSLTALEPYRWLFATVAVGALGYAGYNEWKVSRPDCECETSLSPVARRSLFGAGALVVVALLASPWLIGSSPTDGIQQAAAQQAGGVPTAPGKTETATPAAEGSQTPASFRQVVLQVEGMTCSSCSVAVQRALEGVEGVYQAKVTYQPPQAIVRFNPKKTSPEALTQATKNAGYPSQLKRSS